MRQIKKLIFVGVVFLFIFGIYSVIQKIVTPTALSYEEAVIELNRLLKDIEWTQERVQRKANLALSSKKDILETLPNIEQFQMVVQPSITPNDVGIEIFVSTEKSGKTIDGWMVEAAMEFNAQEIRLNSGKRVQVLIRKIASGTGYEFIASKKYLPDAFSPSSHLWIEMTKAHGMSMNPIRERLVRNIAGIVIKKQLANELKTSYGNLEIKNIIDAVIQGKLAMGYTNPYASSTGLNFLITVLSSFANGTESEMLSPSVISAFENFQKGVPFVCETTIQMRESVQNDGSLDAFVMEYQTFMNTSELKTDYEFIPFGYVHDNPLYSVGVLSDEKKQALERFAQFIEQPRYVSLADQYGFNPSLSYSSAFTLPSGTTLIEAQKLWKEKKDAGKQVNAIFLCDVSGSMAGSRIQALKKSLIVGSEFISKNNAIGLIIFNDQVKEILPVDKFNLSQKASFQAAAEDISSGGGTAMYDGIVVALHQLLKSKETSPPDTKFTLFVLTDGESKSGLDYYDIFPVIAGLKIPIYTIGYEANIDVLKQLSLVVEAASLQANEGEIEYKIGSLLNAQM
ncbi:MAG: VWA domain-containing protein [Desulfobacterales bacterium]|nr:VWA domain-containing protein [Desulfobacterales bacterium]